MQSKNTICVSIKVPGKVLDFDRAIELLGGADLLKEVKIIL